MQAGAGLLQRVADERQGAADMVARGKFRYHAAVLGVHLDLRVQSVRKQAAFRIVERDAGFVAGGFDAEDQHGST